MTCPSRRRRRPPPGLKDFSSTAQRRRAVKRWHGNGRHWTCTTKLRRRNLLLGMVASRGSSCRQTARRFGLGKSHVCRTLHQVGYRWDRRRGTWTRVSRAIVLPTPPPPSAAGKSDFHDLQLRWGIQFTGILGFLRYCWGGNQGREGGHNQTGGG